MRYAILGDVHANLSALETVVTAIESSAVDRILSVGDVVGYGAAPREVIQFLRELDVAVVKGNHDAAVARELDTRCFNPFARAAAEWTSAALGREETAWLRDLPLVQHFEHCSLAHGTFAHPERFDYIQCTEDADPSLDEMPLPLCFVGHTHVPVTILRPVDSPRTGYTIDFELELADVKRALITVGSVGQPRDEDPRAAWGLYDSSTKVFTLQRTEYDIEREAARIRAAGLPDMLADRLFLGV